MQNDEGRIVDLYVPRKCTATNRLLHAKEHGAVQINIAKVDASGLAIPGKFDTVCISGFMRQKGESDACMNRLLNERGLLSFSR